MQDATRSRTRTLWLLAALFAAAGVMLLYQPAGSGDVPAAVSSPRHASPMADGPAGDVASPPPGSQPRFGPTAMPEPAGPVRTRPAIEPEPWLATATAYAEAFTARVGDHADWVAGLEPWVTPHLAEQYELTDPARRPHGAVGSVETIAPGNYSAHVRITYDTGLVLTVRVANGPDGWLVTYVEPVDGLR